jgi:predicted ATP-grasp superfamily ATP-dependent carboligase
MTADNPLYDLVSWPDATDPILVIALEGWIDAGIGAAGAMAHLLQEMDTTLVATFDTDSLVDYRSRRPVMHLVEGVNTGLTWPAIDLRHGVDAEGNDVLLLAGAEPDVRWKDFTADVVALAGQLGVGLVVGLGAYPAPVPHTRATRLSTSATSTELASRVGQLAGTLDVPAGVQAAIERRCAEEGIPNVGLWAQVPHYATAMPFPGASVALLDGLEQLARVRVDADSLRDADRLLRTRLDGLVADNEEHQQMVAQLEEHYDQVAELLGPVPTGDQLAAEVERYLRDLGR